MSRLPPRRRPAPGDLLLGEDHDFVVNAYLALLGRWPDDAGYHHYLDAVRNRPERRVEVLRALAGSEEARKAGTALEIPPGPLLPSDPRQALAAALELRTAHLHAEIERLKEAVELLGGPGGPELAGLGAELLEARDAALRSEIEAARREMRERVEALAALLPAPSAGAGAGAAMVATAEERAARAVAALVADYVGEMLAVAEARSEARLRAIEARLLRLGAAAPDRN
jgi:hypothetical protein